MSDPTTHPMFTSRCCLLLGLIGLTLWTGCEQTWFPPADLSGESFVKLYGVGGNDAFADMAALPDGYLLLGSTDSAGAGQGDLMLIQTDLNGNQQGATRTFGEAGQREEAAFLTAVGDGWVLGGNRIAEDGTEQGFMVWLDGNFDLRTTLELAGAADESFTLRQAVAGINDDLYWIGSTTAVDPLKNNDEDTLSTGDTHDLWIGRINLRGAAAQVEWQRVYGFKGADEGVAIAQEPASGRLWVLANSQFPANSTDPRLLLMLLRDDGYLLDQQVMAPLREEAVDLVFEPTQARWQVLSYQPQGTVWLRQFDLNFAAVDETPLVPLAGQIPTDLTLQGDSLLITGNTDDDDVFAISLDANGNASELLTLGNPGSASLDQGGHILPGPVGTVVVGATLGWADEGSMIMLAQQPIPAPVSL